MKMSKIIGLIPAFLAASTYNIEKIDESVGSSSKLIVVAEEISNKIDGIPAYIFRATNASPSMEYAIIARSMLDEDQILTEWAIPDKDGILSGNNEPYSFIASTMIPGESVFIYLISNDRREFASTKVIPYPISATNHDYKLSVEMAKPVFLNYLFCASGFEPAEEIVLVSRSHNVEEKHQLKTDEKGVVEGFLSPVAEGINKGQAKIELTGKKGSVAVEYSWYMPKKVAITGK